MVIQKRRQARIQTTILPLAALTGILSAAHAESFCISATLRKRHRNARTPDRIPGLYSSCAFKALLASPIIRLL